MKKAITLGLTATILSGLFLVSFNQPAEARRWGVNARQGRQHNRIAQGVKSGELTKRESKRLRAQQKMLAKQEKAFRKSGSGMSKHERAILEKEQNGLSKNIHNQKHDEQERN